MAVRPPQEGSSEPETLEFGIAALDARLDGADVDYPATATELVDALDDPDIPYDASGNAVALEEALDTVPRNQFESETELLEVLHPVFEEYRLSASSSILTRLRALLPF